MTPAGAMTSAAAMAILAKTATFAELVEAGESRDAAYRKWVKLVHPDYFDPPQRSRATKAFIRLNELYAQRAANYRPFATGDIADLSITDDNALLKVPRSPGDNDLMEAEAEALRRLREHGDPKYRPYAPRLIETFLHEDGERKRRRVNVVERLDGFVPLSRITREIDPRDSAWMWRRLLVGLGWAHRAGVIHGAILEEHVLIHPAEHGLALVDWCYSGDGGQVRAIVKGRKDAYPPEVLKSKTATPATDIYMATGLMTRLIGSGIPKSLRRFADGCSYAAPRMRPQNAWRLLGELDDILGPRKFRPFHI